MKQSLQLRLFQHPALMPQLQQSIQLLQLLTIELQQEVEQALIESPLLEQENEWFDASACIGADGSSNASRSNSVAPLPTESPPPTSNGNDSSGSSDSSYESDHDNGTDFDNDYGSDRSDWNPDDFVRKPQPDEDDRASLQLREAEQSLREFLVEQPIPLKFSMYDKGLVTFLIESLDDGGYLSDTLDEILADLPSELRVELDELRATLRVLQSFDPPGIGARSAAECLSLQLYRLDLPAKGPALTIVDQHLELLAACDYTRSKKASYADEPTLKVVYELIRSLAPFPGHVFDHIEADFVMSNVIMHKTNANWMAQLNPDVMPRLCINDMYVQTLRSNRGESGATNLQQKLQEACWLIKNIRQRFNTILRVSQAIIKRRKSFFTHDEIVTCPLVLQEIANTLGLHESTVSCVTTNKYVVTPMGTFELKYFLGSHISTETGGAAPPAAMRAFVGQPVGAEDPKNPLSDSRIAELLDKQGFMMAHRTVVKYRRALKIPAVNLHKSLQSHRGQFRCGPS